MKPTRNTIETFLAFFSILLAILTGVFFSAAASAGPLRLADDSLIVVLAPHTDREKLKTELLSNASAVTARDMHVAREDYSILKISPPRGKREETLGRILGMARTHSSIKSVNRNYLIEHHSPTVNDADYPQQWSLANMDWRLGQDFGAVWVKTPPTMTILATGVTPNFTNNELGPYIKQYNATGQVGGNATQEALFDLEFEGSIDCSISGCQSDNLTLMAGAASLNPVCPVYITMLRITTAQNPGLAAESDIDNALTWAINNQSTRGGPGPVNLSFGTDILSSPQPLWAFSDIQALAGSLRSQGDLLVVSSGDSPGTWTGANGVQAGQLLAGNVAVIQGSDVRNALVNTLPTSDYPTGGLTTVQNDTIAAPGTVQPAIISGQLTTNYYGTSFSAPFVSACLAAMLSVNRKMTTEQAFDIIAQGGKLAGIASPPLPSNPTQNHPKVWIPDFYQALTAAWGYRAAGP